MSDASLSSLGSLPKRPQGQAAVSQCKISEDTLRNTLAKTPAILVFSASPKKRKNID
jgi:hypothetical protein